jgi:hypothetical protein
MPAACRLEANRTMQMAARSNLIISTNPAVGAHLERRIDLGPALPRSNAAQIPIPGDNRGWS